jgi:YD repeat-containing protein
MDCKTKRIFSRGRIVALFVSLKMCAAMIAATMTNASHARAQQVNARDASYSLHWSDATVQSAAPGEPSTELKLKRIYRSRSLSDGAFGFGWCSPWETSVRRAPQGVALVRDCEAPAEIQYPRAPQGAPLARAINHPGDLLRIEAGGGYTRYAPDGSVQRFDSGGRLRSRTDPRGGEVSFVYDAQGRLREARTRAGHALRFEYKGPSRRVDRVTGPGGIKVLYSFDGDNLVGVTDSRGTLLTYRYDDLHNMTEAKRSDGWREKITYDADRDWALKRESADGCSENYSYTSGKRTNAAGDERATTQVTRTCGKKISKARYDFWYRESPRGRDALVRAKINRDGITFDFVFNPVTGIPTKVTKADFRKGKE